MPELMIAVVDESGLEGQDISKYLHGRVVLDRFEHAGAHPLFMIFHWYRDSEGTAHSVSIIDDYIRMKDFSAKNSDNENHGIERISIVFPPDVASGRGWIIEHFVEATVEKLHKSGPAYIIYKTLRQSYKYLLSDVIEKAPYDQRVILKNLALTSLESGRVPETKVGFPINESEQSTSGYPNLEKYL